MLILEFLVKRIAQGLLIVFITSLIIFTLLRVVPGDPVRLIVGGMAPPDVVEKVATKMGLRDPFDQKFQDQHREELPCISAKGDPAGRAIRPAGVIVRPSNRQASVALLISCMPFG